MLTLTSKSGKLITVEMVQRFPNGLVYINVTDSEGRGPVDGYVHRYPEGDCVLEGRWARKQGFRFDLTPEQVAVIDSEIARIEATREPLTFSKSPPPKPERHPDDDAHFWANRDDSSNW